MERFAIDKLNFGCGSDFIDGWLNIGLFNQSEIPYGIIARKNGALVLNLDVTAGLPVEENSIIYAYASHFIEHLSFKEGRLFLERCYKHMRQGGIIRLTFPDLELWVAKYYENDGQFFERYRSIFLGGVTAQARTKGEIFMSQVHNWGHQWGYDFESISHILSMAGFSQVSRRKVHESAIPDIENLEPISEGRLLETADVEATK
jgi:predicted SAM-dependent methyltransferase